MTESGKEDTDAYSARGTGAAVVGAAIGLVTVTVLATLIFLIDDAPDFTGGPVGSLALTLVYASPYLLTLLASRVNSPGTRGGLLLAFGLLSFAASFSAVISTVTLVLLPATLVVWFAAARSLTVSARSLAATAIAVIAGILIAATVGLSWLTLFAFADPEPRCWVLTLGTDGRHVWEARPDLVKQGEELTISLGGFDREGSCVGDTISYPEAGVSAGLLAIAFVVMILTMRLPWIRRPESGRT